MTHRQILWLAVPVAVVSSLLSVWLLANLKINPRSAQPPAIPLVDAASLARLPRKNGSSADTSHVAAGLIPPTNSWLSGMVLQASPLAVYPMPLSFLAKNSGFELGLPTVTSTATVIAGGHTAGLSASIIGATGFKLDRYDKTLARLVYTGSNGPLGDLTLAQGSPYVFYRARQATVLTVETAAATGSGGPSYLRYSRAGHDYALVASQGATIKLTGATALVTAPAGSLVTAYGLPAGRDDQLRGLAGNELVGVKVSAGSGATATTTFDYQTANQQPTVWAAMGYARVTSAGRSLGTYDSIYGPMTARFGQRFTTAVAVTAASNRLNLAAVTPDHRQQLLVSLQRDVAMTTITANDSYFAGKQLARAATLLDLAEQLGQTASITRLKSILNDGFGRRLGGNYFYYDSTLKGVAAQTRAFGSEDFNDHYFHYGYFIYAASILGRYDHNFLVKHQAQINLLVADIASDVSSVDFPVRRNYDAYSAHSWAAGLAPFADGNNQESSSEAINAWNAVAKWGELTSNRPLQASAQWMLSNEAATARSAWRTVDVRPTYLAGYTSPLASLNFGGKRTYSTFFSDQPSAKLGVQLLPLSPVMTSLVSDGPVITDSIKASIAGDNFNVPLGDYDLMYLALIDPVRAAGLLSRQTDQFIDDGNSRSYLEAWTFYQTDKAPR